MKLPAHCRSHVLAGLAAVLALAACTGPGATGPGPRPPLQPPSGDLVADLQNSYVQVAKQVGPSVVLIETPQGLGSGVIFDGSGDIVTNYHVVAGSDQFRVTLVDGKRLAARLVGTAVSSDLAVVKVSAGSLRPAGFGKSADLQVGDIVMAIGNPLGLRSSVTAGIVSALDRQVQEPNGVTIPGTIQTSAPINPGNSGGALVDLQGQVVGIPTLAASDPELNGAASGIGFAISSDMAKQVATQIIQHGSISAPQSGCLGVEVGQTGGNGVLVGPGSNPGGPALKAGIQPGDIIASLNGKPTPTVGALIAALAGLGGGQPVTVHVIHSDGSQADVKVTLAQPPCGG